MVSEIKYVSVIIPARNEEATIATCMALLLVWMCVIHGMAHAYWVRAVP